MKDVLAVEEQLARVRTDIERAEAQMGQLKDRVAMSTVRITATEKHREPAKQSFLTQLTNACRTSLHTFSEAVKGLVILVVYGAPWAVLLAVSLLSIWLFARRSRVVA